MKNWEPKPPGTLWATPDLLRDCVTFIPVIKRPITVKGKRRLRLRQSYGRPRSDPKHGQAHQYVQTLSGPTQCVSKLHRLEDAGHPASGMSVYRRKFLALKFIIKVRLVNKTISDVI